jgi:hypothetical protein
MCNSQLDAVIVRAVPKEALGLIAVPAKNLEVVWKSRLDDIFVETRRAANALAVIVAVIIDVVNGQKREFCLAATSALAAVMIYYDTLHVLSPCLVSSSLLYLVFLRRACLSCAFTNSSLSCVRKRGQIASGVGATSQTVTIAWFRLVFSTPGTKSGVYASFNSLFRVFRLVGHAVSS